MHRPPTRRPAPTRALAALALAALALLSACKELPLPMDLTGSLEDFREGSRTLELPLEVREAAVRTPAKLARFTPPSPALTHAEAAAALRLTLSSPSAPSARGWATARLYLAPEGQELYRPEFLVLEEAFPVGEPATVEARGQLTPAQLDGLNAGALQAGLEVSAALDRYVRTVRAEWKVEKLYVGVGLF